MGLVTSAVQAQNATDFAQLIVGKWVCQNKPTGDLGIAKVRSVIEYFADGHQRQTDWLYVDRRIAMRITTHDKWWIDGDRLNEKTTLLIVLRFLATPSRSVLSDLSSASLNKSHLYRRLRG